MVCAEEFRIWLLEFSASLKAYAHDDVSVGSWMMGVNATYIDDSRLCCSYTGQGNERVVCIVLCRRRRVCTLQSAICNLQSALCLRCVVFVPCRQGVQGLRLLRFFGVAEALVRSIFCYLDIHNRIDNTSHSYCNTTSYFPIFLLLIQLQFTSLLRMYPQPQPTHFFIYFRLHFSIYQFTYS